MEFLSDTARSLNRATVVNTESVLNRPRAVDYLTVLTALTKMELVAGKGLEAEVLLWHLEDLHALSAISGRQYLSADAVRVDIEMVGGARWNVLGKLMSNR